MTATLAPSRLPDGGRAFLVSPMRNMDVSAAERWAPLVLLLKRPPSPYQPGPFIQAVLDAAAQHRFNPDADAYVLAGSRSQSTLAYGALLIQYTRLQVLMYAERSEVGGYKLVRVDPGACSPSPGRAMMSPAARIQESP